MYLERLMDPVKRRKIQLTFITVSPEHVHDLISIYLIQTEPEVHFFGIVRDTLKTRNFNYQYVNCDKQEVNLST